MLFSSFAWAASERYIAFFSAEQENYRRLLIDGVANRRVNVELDTLGRVEVLIRGVNEREYVGLRDYERGYLVPVNINVSFPQKDRMSIVLTGSRFKEMVRYREISTGIYIVDLYVQHLPQESVFREQTISALWPGDRFTPDISTAGERLQLASSTDLSLPALIIAKLTPYRHVIYRAMFWAAALFIIIIAAAVPILLIQRNLQAARFQPVDRQKRSRSHQNRLDGSAKAHDIMRKNGGVSFEEASLLADLEGDGLSRA
ncbi:MAG: hypothetical protein KAU50_09515 [Candidatus Marinimicrobia bacterium]|nr:hypothetical protein [Candidatus Neomarinimicrobiota bacterium]